MFFSSFKLQCPAALYSLASAHIVKAFGVGWWTQSSKKTIFQIWFLSSPNVHHCQWSSLSRCRSRSWRGEFRQRHLATALDFGRSPGDASERWDVFGDSASNGKVRVWKGKTGTKWQLPHFIDLSTGRITAKCMMCSKSSAWEGWDHCQTWSFDEKGCWKKSGKVVHVQETLFFCWHELIEYPLLWWFTNLII